MELIVKWAILLVLLTSCGTSPKPSKMVKGPVNTDLVAETENIRQPSFIHSDKGGWHQYIEFHDSLGGSKRLDIIAANPFTGLPARVTGTSYGLNVYEFEPGQAATVLSAYDLTETGSQVRYADGQVLVAERSLNPYYTVVTNLLYLQNQEGYVIQIVAQYDVYTTGGKLIKSVLDSNAGDVAQVSFDGERIMTKYGGAFGGEGEYSIPEGFKVIEINSGRTSLDFKLPGRLNVRNHAYFAAGHYFVLHTMAARDTVVCFVVDGVNSSINYFKSPYSIRPRIDSVHYYQHGAVLLEDKDRTPISIATMQNLSIGNDER